MAFIIHPDHSKSWNFIQGFYRLIPTQLTQHAPKTTYATSAVVWTHCLSTEARMFIEKPIQNRSNGLAMPHLHPHLYVSSLLYILYIMWFHFLPLFEESQNHCVHPPLYLSQLLCSPKRKGLLPVSSWKLLICGYLCISISISMATFLPPTQVVGFSFVLDFQKVITIIAA